MPIAFIINRSRLQDDPSLLHNPLHQPTAGWKVVFEA